MDLLAAAARAARTHGDLLNLVAGQPSTPAPGPGARGGQAGARRAGARLHRGARHPRAARGDRRPPPADARPRRRPRRRRRHHRLLRRVPAGVPRRLRGRRPGGDRPAGLPLLPQRAHRARLRGRRAAGRPETRFQPTVADARGRSTSRCRAWWSASPANPTGTMLRPRELAALATWCEEHGVQLISDEIYHGIEYATPDAARRRAWETSREAVVFNSFSKYFSMTGWRIGWMLVPERLRRRRRRAHRQLHDLPAGARPARRRRGVRRRVVRRVRRARRAVRREPAAAARRAAAARHRPAGPGRRRVLRLRRRRPPDRRLDGVLPPAARARPASRRRPGIDFDTVVGNRFVRLSFAGSTAEVGEALARLEDWLSPVGRRSSAGLAPPVLGRPAGSVRTSRGTARSCARSMSTSSSSRAGTAAAAIPDTAECTIAGALRLAKLAVLPQPRAVKPRAQSRACGTSSRRGRGARVDVVLGAALELVEHPLAAQQPDRRDALPLRRRHRQRRERGLAGDPGVHAGVRPVEPDHLTGSSAPAGCGRSRRRGR